MPSHLVMCRLLVAVVLPMLCAGCSSDTFGCLEEDQCGKDGRCESNGYCSFPDAECESGRRFAESATDGVANVCVPLETATDNVGSTDASTTLASTGGPESSSDSGGTDSSTDFTSSTSPGSSDSSSESTGPAVDCVDDSTSCLECFSCTDGLTCTDLAQACGGTQGCIDVSQCFSGCEGTGSCFEDCCEGASPAAIEAASMLSECHRKACLSASCTSFPEPMCGSR